uniref:Inhibitory synaptic factor 2A n=1 Tax=Leptobrachium leishanense TaxID=445787 RepID=A0A8C5QAV4_9ANUR
MVSKEGEKCVLTSSESEVEPAVSLALEMKYALDPNRQIKKRNKALQVRFKDICEAQNEQRDKQLSTVPQTDKDTKSLSCKAYRKYMTVPARRSIPNVTKSTGVQTSPDLKKRYQTFPLDRKKGNLLKNAAGVDTLKSQNNGFVIDVKDKSDHRNSGETIQCSRFGENIVGELLIHSSEDMDSINLLPSSNCSDACKSTDLHSCTKESPSLQSPANSTSEQAICHLHDTSKHDKRPLGNMPSHHPAHVKVLLKEEATIHSPTLNPNLIDPEDINPADESTERTICPLTEEESKRTAHINGLQTQDTNLKACTTSSQCPTEECNEQTLQLNVLPKNQPCQTPVPLDDDCHQIVPHTEVIDLKAQLQTMESLISSSQETIKVLLGVIQELEKGEAHREGVELDFKQQEDKLQPVLKKLHPIEETQVAPLPYPAESYTSTPKQKSKTESKKHGRWKLWFL